MNQNMGKLMQQAQQFQEQLKKMQQAQQNLEVQGQSGAGLVKVTMTGKYDVKRVHLDSNIMSEEKEIIEDLLAAAVNDAVQKIESKTQSDFSGLSQNIKLPSGMNFPFN